MHKYYFRGTTVDYPGNATQQRAGVTPVTTDPRKATVFAIESSRFGSGVVHIIDANKIPSEKILPPNWFGARESEVVLSMQIIDFTAIVDASIPLHSARAILAGMGELLPAGVPDKASIDHLLESLGEPDPTLIERFVAQVKGR